MPRTARSAGERVYSVSALLAYDACPWQYYYTFVRGYPPPVSPAMRRGTSVHSLISRQLRKGQALPPDTTDEIRTLLTTFERSRFNLPPVASEMPFRRPVGDVHVRGRIDLILPGPDDSLEIIDFKSGSLPPEKELSPGLQLPIYALATAQLFDRPPEELRYTYYFLGNDREVSYRGTEQSFQETNDRVRELIAAIERGMFTGAPDCTCYACQRRGQWRGVRAGT